MKLTKRGEVVLAAYISITALLFAGAVVTGVVFLATHHQVIDQTTCEQTEDGLACDFKWERN
jgi:hypothetical protein